MNNQLAEIQKQYREQFERAAFGYLKAGFDQFISEQKQSSYAGSQSIIGNLAIAIELMLKSFIASKSLLLLFKSLPVEIRVLLTNPESVPSSFNWRAFEVELKSAAYPTIELNECISLFYLFFPDKRSALRSYLRMLSKARNASVHAILPVFQQEYEAARVAYVAALVSDTLKPHLLIAGHATNLHPEIEEFIRDFQEERIERVHKAIDAAKEQTKKLPPKSDGDNWISINYWQQEMIKCPICGASSILNGATEKITWSRRGDEEISEPGLWFFPESFHCNACGLMLADYEELKLAGIEVDSSLFDRSEELQEFEEDTPQIRSYKA